MDDSKKLFEGLLKADGIEPAGVSESERAVFKKMLDSEQKRMKRLSRRVNTTLWIFVLAMGGLCLSENILEALHVPFYVGCFVIGIAMLFVMIRYMPGHNRMMKESGSKISKLYYLVHGRRRGVPLVGKKNGKRFIYWPRIIMIAAVIWLATSLGGAGVFYLFCQHWVYSSEPMLHIFYCTVVSLSLVIFVLCDGLKTPLEELVEVKTKQSKPGSQSGVWRIIMTSTITKFVAAGVFVAAILLSITFLDKTVAPAYAIEQSFETMKRATWMHVARDSGAGNFEYWISYPKKIVAAKHSSGKVTYHDNNMLFTYEPSSEKLTISQTEIDAFGTLGQSPLRFVENVKTIFLETDGEIIEEQILHNQKNATIYKMTTIIEAKNVLVEFVVGNEDNLPVQMVQQYFDAENGSHKKVVINIDYLEFGPRSIYDIGVPKETTIVNNMPTKNVSQLLEAFQSHKNGAPSRYIAVAADYFFYQPAATNIIFQVRVIYKDGKYQRVEYYGVPQDNLAGYYENWHISKSQMGDTVESLLSWWQGSEIALLAQIDLYDGKFYYQLRRDDNLKWKTLPRVYSLKNDFRADDDIADFGWDAYLSASITDSGSSPLAVVENDYSNDNNLICLETKTQGRIITDSVGKVWAVAPSRKAYYLNPERDYICHRFEQEEKFDAPWQKDKGLIKTIEQEHINKNPAVNRVREVTEYGQTEQGLWYPKIIKSWNPNNASSSLRVKRVYLNSDPVFPDNIFNSKLLPE